MKKIRAARLSAEGTTSEKIGAKNIGSRIGSLSAAAGFVLLLAAAPSRTQASETIPDLAPEGVLDVIDIRPVIARHDIGNALGLAYDPGADVLYLAHGSDPRGGFIYTLDSEGNLLYELDLQLAHLPESYPLSLSYDETSGQLFVLVYSSDASPFPVRMLVLDPVDFSLSAMLSADLDGGGGIHVSGDGIWQARFTEDLLRHYTLLGTFLDDVSVAGSFLGFPGPLDVTSSYLGGFFVVDHFDRRIVEVDATGRELAAVSTAELGDGRGIAIDSDPVSQRIFLQVNNEEIYVLSSDFIGGAVTTVLIDIKPGGSDNNVNINRKTGTRVRVAILTTEATGDADAFDATTVDPLTVRFGRSDLGAPPVRHTFSDVDRDGKADMVLQFEVAETGIECEDPTAVLTGETYAGERIRGIDMINPVGCQWRSSMSGGPARLQVEKIAGPAPLR